MEDKNNNNDFEQFLRSSIEDFKMIPSRKIWYGIYNSMHPDRKWPSIAVCLIILTAVMFVGVANNNSISISARKNAEEGFLANTVANTVTQKQISSALVPQKSFVSNINPKPIAENTVSNTSNNIARYVNNTSNQSRTPALSAPTNNPSGKSKSTSTYNENVATNNTDMVETEMSHTANESLTATSIKEEKNNTQQVDGKMIIHISNVQPSEVDNNLEIHTIAKINEKDTKKSFIQNNTITTKEKLLSDVNVSNTSLHKNKFSEKGSLLYYITPSFGYRKITNNQAYKSSVAASNSLASSTISNNTKDNMVDAFALNLEAGAVLQYKVSKNIRFKTGLQANYTNYISKVTELDHPTQTSIAATGQSNYFRGAYYASKEGNTHLNKTTWQIALPIGLDVKLAGNDKLKWYVAATAQPTYILSGNAFVLSADASYYITEPALINKWNINTAIETFLSFKPSAGVTLNIGPQFRYQLFSSYKKTYNYSEKLYNVGVKVGLSTNF
jgi:hypothetical protein